MKKKEITNPKSYKKCLEAQNRENMTEKTPFPDRKAVKRKIKPYKYFRKGKQVKVPTFKRRYYLRKGTKKQAIPRKTHKSKFSERVEMEKAKEIFKQKSERSQTMDIKHVSKIMFSVPNKMWADATNKFDIWGLDGFDAPKVDELPEKGLPFQLLKYKSEIYEADARGNFTTPDIKVIDLAPEDPENQKQFELETNKNALWNEKPTKAYEKWLSKNARLEDIASKLDYTSSKNKLYKIREAYNALKLSNEDQKKLMLKLYNKIYENL